ncbi:MAG: PTS sugar transporter subunit IIA [Oryzihumus sp.]|jgi:fructose-specific phosphotransferase system IIA component|uniref:PTS system fructose-specific IIA component n=1 Tax=Oryzihumus leptocrescens TaxID=297536 RepID=A0A542ZJQ2_9MICO|nr:PTS sugar transporter subunit IIA [Oryzihumus leptocrescens]TQL60508.1 PTS system fructose-specific IIA component [Oryzihumus leptocrescens]
MALITDKLVVLDLEAPDRHAATRILAEALDSEGRVTDLDGFLADVRKREEQMPTGLPGGIGIPHARSAHVTEPSLVFGRTAGVDFGAEDGPATLIFLIAAPEGGGEEHLAILAKLARRLVRPDFRQSLHDAPDSAAVVDIVTREVVNQ